MTSSQTDCVSYKICYRYTFLDTDQRREKGRAWFHFENVFLQILRRYYQSTRSPLTDHFSMFPLSWERMILIPRYKLQFCVLDLLRSIQWMYLYSLTKYFLVVNVSYNSSYNWNNWTRSLEEKHMTLGKYFLMLY